MSLGRRTERQESLWVSYHEMPECPGNPFYQKLNAILEKDGFDAFVENLCVPYYAGNVGRRSIPPAGISACCCWAISRASTRNGASVGGWGILFLCVPSWVWA